jgi:uncharacterized surface protein with fasciclin (FAS1) repeats
MKNWSRSLLLAASAAFLVACGSDDEPEAAAPGTVAEVATSAGFSALVAAANKAGLAPALSDSSAALTVFAPTDAAFNALATSLGFANATAMVTALDAATLAKILSFHVLPSQQDAAALIAAGASQATLYNFPAGTPAALTVDGSAGVRLTDAAGNQATVTTADVAASNGVIHVIDKVLVPPGVLTVVQMAQSNANFSILVEAVVAADLAGALSGAGPLTVFAPTNDAFASALSELGTTKPALLADPGLADILKFHVVAGAVKAADVLALPKPAAVVTLLGSSFTVGADLRITDGRRRTATLLATDLIASNGVIHVIDKVLLPAL